MASTQQLRRLQRVEVDGLFGLYDHCIDLELNDRVTFLHGPNGVGKTTVLRMIDAVLTDRFDYFSRVPFKRFLLRFDDKAELELDFQEWKTVGGQIRLVARGYYESVAVESALSDAAAIAAEVGHLVRERDIWVDIRDGKLLTDSEVLREFAGLRLSSGLAMRHRVVGEDVQKLRENSSTGRELISLRHRDWCGHAALDRYCREWWIAVRTLSGASMTRWRSTVDRHRCSIRPFLNGYCNAAMRTTICPSRKYESGCRSLTARLRN